MDLQPKNDSDEGLNLSSDSNSQMSQEDQPDQISYENRIKYHLRVPFPSERYAECCMKSLGVDPPFMDTKNRKTTIRREMYMEVLEDGITYLNIILSCDPSKDKVELNSLRTCASSMLTNLQLICQTIKEFGD